MATNQSKNSEVNVQEKIGGRPKTEPSKTIRVPMVLVDAVESMIETYRKAKKKYHSKS